jgi:isopenicillin N synthase-like dioxygenase
MVRVVDISAWVGGKKSSYNGAAKDQCATELDQALQETGMVIITGHGVPKVVLNDLLRSMDEWFSSMSVEDKEKRFTLGPYGCIEGGYTKMGIEAVGASVGKDALKNVDGVESFVFRGKPTKFTGKEAPRMQPMADAYYDHVTRLLATLHAIICHALGVDENFFYESGIIPSTDIHSLKLSYYPHEESASPDKLRYGAHTDFQDLTVLRPSQFDWVPFHRGSSRSGDADDADGADGADDAGGADDGEVVTSGGLQVYDKKTEQWQCVVVPDGGEGDEPLCVNLGDFWEIWSNGKYVSPLHRVTAYGYKVKRSQAKAGVKEGGAVGSCVARKSVIFFSVPDDRAVIRPLPGVLPAKGSSFIYDGVDRSAGEHLAMKLARINA